ncbi:MAG: hypothetical protein IPP14_05870 [Planctomycetes bacterium]|nr:hypothetical protein [Planctomycetota bacterium]
MESLNNRLGLSELCKASFGLAANTLEPFRQFGLGFRPLGQQLSDDLGF